jgi:hypothetical protein
MNLFANISSALLQALQGKRLVRFRGDGIGTCPARPMRPHSRTQKDRAARQAGNTGACASLNAVQDDPAFAKGLRGTGRAHARSLEIVLCETL